MTRVGKVVDDGCEGSEPCEEMRSEDTVGGKLDSIFLGVMYAAATAVTQPKKYGGD